MAAWRKSDGKTNYCGQPFSNRTIHMKTQYMTLASTLLLAAIAWTGCVSNIKDVTAQGAY